MVSIEKVNIKQIGDTSFTSQTENSNKQQKSTIKKYLTAPNIVLASLATIGVLGMADILICKGKHINKEIFRENKKLSDAIKGLERDIEKRNTRINELYEENTSLRNKNFDLEDELEELRRK